MWYFCWILGLGLALTFGVLNAIWFEVTADTKVLKAARGVGDSKAGEGADCRDDGLKD